MAPVFNTGEYHVWLKKKEGIYPLNPGEVTDRQVAPSALFTTDPSPSTPDTSSGTRSDATPDASSVTRSDATPDTSSVIRSDVSDRDSEYRKKYEEGYDIYTDDYLQWIRDNNLTLPTEDPFACTSGSSQPLPTVSSSNCGESTSSSLSKILALPKPLAPKKKGRKPAVNAKASCITDPEVLDDLKQQKNEKEAKEQEKAMKRLQKEKIRKREKERRRKRERRRNKSERRRERERRKNKRRRRKSEKRNLKKDRLKRVATKSLLV